MLRALWGSKATEDRPGSGLLTGSDTPRPQAAPLQISSKGVNLWHAESAGAKHSALILKSFGSFRAKRYGSGGRTFSKRRAPSE